MIKSYSLTALIILAACVWALVLSGNGWGIPTSFFAPLSFVGTILSAVLVLFDRWAWAFPGLRLLVSRPDLRGSWKGTIQSMWIDPATGSKPGPIDIYMVVRQTFTEIHMQQQTASSTAKSVTATLTEDADKTHTLFAIYRNIPRLPLRKASAIHHGSVVLRLSGEPCKTLMGEYWTDRETRGEVEFERVSRDTSGAFVEQRLRPL